MSLITCEQYLGTMPPDRVRLHRNRSSKPPRGLRPRSGPKRESHGDPGNPPAIKACETATAAWKQVSYKRRALIISVISLFAKARLGDHAIP